MPEETITEARDDLETAILLALSARHKGTDMHRGRTKKTAGPHDKRHFELGMFCPRQPEFPEDAYTFDARSQERLYSYDMDDIVVDPALAIGSALETMMLCEDGSLKWTKIKPMPKPKGIIAITNRPHRWFAWHYRHVREGAKDEYVKRPFALTDDGKVCLLKPMDGLLGFRASEDREAITDQLAMTLSIFEDAKRAGSFLATVEEHTKLRFPVGQEAYLDFMRLRDGPNDTPTGRKNPILHWCSSHLRRTVKGSTEVQTHLRGTEEVVVGPMRLTIEANTGYGAFMMQPGAATPATET